MCNIREVPDSQRPVKHQAHISANRQAMTVKHMAHVTCVSLSTQTYPGADGQTLQFLSSSKARRLRASRVCVADPRQACQSGHMVVRKAGRRRDSSRRTPSFHTCSKSKVAVFYKKRDPVLSPCTPPRAGAKANAPCSFPSAWRRAGRVLWRRTMAASRCASRV